MHASYGLVKTRLICYVGKMWMLTRIEIRIISQLEVSQT